MPDTSEGFFGGFEVFEVVLSWEGVAGAQHVHE